MKKASGCNQCTHPSCTCDLIATGVASCGQCPNGILNLDPISGPSGNLLMSSGGQSEDANKLLLVLHVLRAMLVKSLWNIDQKKISKLVNGLTSLVFCSPKLSRVGANIHQISR